MLVAVAVATAGLWRALNYGGLYREQNGSRIQGKAGHESVSSVWRSAGADPRVVGGVCSSGCGPAGDDPVSVGVALFL